MTHIKLYQEVDTVVHFALGLVSFYQFEKHRSLIQQDKSAQNRCGRDLRLPLSDQFAVLSHSSICADFSKFNLSDVEYEFTLDGYNYQNVIFKDFFTHL
jgi:hypothetical protein